MGAYDYIEKPPDLNNLLNSVRSALVKTKTKKISKKLKRLIPNMKLLVSQNKLKALRV